jgi:subtilisin family serine protease
MKLSGRFLSSLLFIPLALSTANVPAEAKTLGHKGYLVKFRSPLSLVGATVTLQSTGIQVESEIPELNLVRVKSHPLENQSPSAALSTLQSMIEYVEPNYIVRAIGEVKTPSVEAQASRQEPATWGQKAVLAESAWAITKGSRDVVVAVSDTGIWDHGDLKANRWKNTGEVGKDSSGKDKSKNGIDDDQNGFIDDVDGWNFETNVKNPSDDHYHGTHVAGTIGAVGGNNQGVAGMAWTTSLMAVKFLGRDGSGTTEGGINTILYAAKNGAKAVNCSWGGDGYSQSMFEAIEYAKSKGMLVVAAAGNENNDNDRKPSYPAAYENENLITIAALDTDKSSLTYFSNFGLKSVDLAAPGLNIYSTFNPMYSQLHRVFYNELSGTSMAAPHVAGTIALMYSANPKLNWKQVKDILLATVIKSKKLEGRVVSGGTLNAGAAVRAAADAK